jgi:hypothetical protein
MSYSSAYIRGSGGCSFVGSIAVEGVFGGDCGVKVVGGWGAIWWGEGFLGIKQ